MFCLFDLILQLAGRWKERMIQTYSTFFDDMFYYFALLAWYLDDKWQCISNVWKGLAISLFSCHLKDKSSYHLTLILFNWAIPQSCPIFNIQEQFGEAWDCL